MKIVVLSDNRGGDGLLESEHGLSVYLETAQFKCLLDVGASDKFIRNAEKWGLISEPLISCLSLTDMLIILAGCLLSLH